MANPPDLTPAAARMARVLEGLTDDRLTARTPCDDFTVGDLVEHAGGLAVAFRAAAAKELGPVTAQAPPPDGSRLGAGWRIEIPPLLAALAQAWRKPDAWTGMTQVGGVDLPGQAAGMFALDELVVHGWDIAVASGQPYEPDGAELEPLLGLLIPLSQPDQAANRDGLFGPVVDVPADAPLLHRVLGLSGRSPDWQR